MGILAKTLSPSSSYAAKKTGLWQELMDRLTDCMLPEGVDAFERYLVAITLQIPPAWEEPLAEVIAKRRAEIAENDITEIMRSKFDF